MRRTKKPNMRQTSEGNKLHDVCRIKRIVGYDVRLMTFVGFDVCRIMTLVGYDVCRIVTFVANYDVSRL